MLINKLLQVAHLLKFSAMILAADTADFMNNNLIELLNNYIQRATFHGDLCPFIWKMETSRNPSEFVS
jgi:hypothetical protein